MHIKKGEKNMNAKALERKLKEINRSLPKKKCIEDDECGGEHMTKLYKLTCLAYDSFSAGLTTKRTVRNWGKIIHKYEYYPGEAGLGHFTCFDGI